MAGHRLVVRDSPPAPITPTTFPHLLKAARVLTALNRDNSVETRSRGSHRVLVNEDRRRICACHDGMEVGGPAMARILRTTATPLLSCASYRKMITMGFTPRTVSTRAWTRSSSHWKATRATPTATAPVSVLEDFLAPRSSHVAGVFGLR